MAENGSKGPTWVWITGILIFIVSGLSAWYIKGSFDFLMAQNEIRRQEIVDLNRRVEDRIIGKDRYEADMVSIRDKLNLLINMHLDTDKQTRQMLKK